MIRSAPIAEDSHQPAYIETLTPALDKVSLGPEPGTSDDWSEPTYSQEVLWDLDQGGESKDYSSDSESDSELTITEETDTDSNASELNYTWELNTDLSEENSGQAQSSGYFELDSLEDTESSTDRYFSLAALDDTAVDMADGEPPVPLPEDQVHDDNGVVALSDDEQVPPADVEDEVVPSDDEAHVMEVDDSKKSFNTTLGDEKQLDGIIDDMAEKQTTGKKSFKMSLGGEKLMKLLMTWAMRNIIICHLSSDFYLCRFVLFLNWGIMMGLQIAQDKTKIHTRWLNLET